MGMRKRQTTVITPTHRSSISRGIPPITRSWSEGDDDDDRIASSSCWWSPNEDSASSSTKKSKKKVYYCGRRRRQSPRPLSFSERPLFIIIIGCGIALLLVAAWMISCRRVLSTTQQDEEERKLLSIVFDTTQQQNNGFISPSSFRSSTSRGRALSTVSSSWYTLDDQELILRTSSSYRKQHQLASEADDETDDRLVPDDGTTDGPDYGGLEIVMTTMPHRRRRGGPRGYHHHHYHYDDGTGDDHQDFRRRIVVDEERLHAERETLLEQMDEISHGGRPIDTWDEFDSHNSEKCMAPPWTFVQHANCNTIHEIVDDEHDHHHHHQYNTDGGGGSYQYLGRGFYRDAFFYHEEENDGYVMKKLHIDRDLNQRQLLKVNNEANIMEHLHHSGSVGTLYGHCGTTVLVEPGTDLSHQIVPDHPWQSFDRGYFAPAILDRLYHRQQQQEKRGGTVVVGVLYQNNDLSAMTKLRLAISMVESIALLHGFPGGVIAHDDISLDQWMVRAAGGGHYRGNDDDDNTHHRGNDNIILNDFNSIRPLHVNVETGRYCRFNSRTGNLKAPEYYTSRQKLVTEQSDLWPLGLIIYTLLTGLMPYHDAANERDVNRQTMVGAIPALDPILRQRSFIERRLADAMDRCLVHDPHDRVDVFWLRDYLYETMALHRRRQRQHHYDHRLEKNP